MKTLTNPPPEDLFADGLTTVAQAAKFLSLGRSKIYGLMNAGELHFVKLGNSRRIPKRALLDLATANLKGGWMAMAV